MMFSPEFARTDDGWAASVLPRIDELLIEQAHLEKKAASAAIGYLFRYPKLTSIHARLSELAREELEHFEQVLALCDARGIDPGPLKPGTYAGRLVQVIRQQEPWLLLDRLLVNGVIEARSCERMRLLSVALRGVDDELARFYHELVVSEARHHDLYVRLAEEVAAPRDEVRERLAEILRHEGEILAQPIRHAGAPRLHV
jgi:tRNA-(ms[2]io[6]A)-hydroxylase